MAHPAPGRGPGSAVLPAKASIAYVCRLLSELGVCPLQPEALRQAKFDTGGEPVIQALRRALHDICVLTLCGFPHTGDVAPALDAAWGDGSSPDSAQAFVAHTLSCWACPPALVRALDTGGEAETSSRAVLLALAWTLARTDACAHALRVRLMRLAVRGRRCPRSRWLPCVASTTDSALVQGPHAPNLVPPFPFDTACTPAARAAGEAAAAAASACVEDAARLRAQPGPSRDDVAAQQVLLLQSRVRGITRQLAGLSACAAEQAHALATHSSGRSAAPLSPYDLHLLRSPPAALAAAHATASAALAAADEQAACGAHVDVFFAWAGSALDEAEQAAAETRGVVPSASGARVSTSRLGQAAAATFATADALRREVDAELARRQADTVALAQRWQGVPVRDAATAAGLEQCGARVDACLPQWGSFADVAMEGRTSGGWETHAVDQLPEQVSALLHAASARRDAERSAAAVLPSLHPHLVLLPQPSASTRRPGSSKTTLPPELPGADVCVVSAAEELRRLHEHGRLTSDVLRHVTADNAAALRAAVAPFAAVEEFLIAGFD